MKKCINVNENILTMCRYWVTSELKGEYLNDTDLINFGMYAIARNIEDCDIPIKMLYTEYIINFKCKGREKNETN